MIESNLSYLNTLYGAANNAAKAYGLRFFTPGNKDTARTQDRTPASPELHGVQTPLPLQLHHSRICITDDDIGS